MINILAYIWYSMLRGVEIFMDWYIIWTGIIDNKYQITVTMFNGDEYVIHPKELI